MLKDFISAMRGGICGSMGNRYINGGTWNKSYSQSQSQRLQPSLKNLRLHYMDTDSFVLGFSEGSVDDKNMDLSNLDTPIKANNKVPGKFKHERGVER